MKLFGLTGGIGMGKSTARRLLEERGFPVIDTDDVARQLVEPGQPALAEITIAFGAQMLTSDGELNRAELARRVFLEPPARKKLEAILHPPIRRFWLEETKRWRERSVAFGFVIIPLLFETAAEVEFDAVICVACSEATQLARLRARGWSDEQIQQRLAAQWPVEKKITQSDVVIWTDTTLEVHAEQLRRLLNEDK